MTVNRLLNGLKAQRRKNVVFALALKRALPIWGNGCTNLELEEGTECLEKLLGDCIENE